MINRETPMPKWQTIDTAPKDGTWIKVRGHDFGDRTRRRHYAIAFYDHENWNEVGSEGGLLYYLDGWQPLSNGHRGSEG
jgi:hypothetical protein